jgi:hypothetical protein
MRDNPMMTRPDPKEPRTASLSVRTKPSIKALVDRFALEDDLSVTQVIERMVAAEAARRYPEPAPERKPMKISKEVLERARTMRKPAK